MSSGQSALHLVFSVHHDIMAVPVSSIVRMALADEVKIEAVGDRMVVTSGDTAYCAWDLGTLFDQPPVDSAWIFAEVPTKDGPLPIALRSGACLMVGGVELAREFPDGFLHGRGRAVTGAFAVPERLAGERASVGWMVDLTRLLTQSEIAQATGVLRASQSKMASAS